MKKYFFFLIFLLLPRFAHSFFLYHSEDVSFSLKGYYKNLYFTTQSQGTGDRLHADLNRIRTEWDAKFWKKLSAKVIWDNEIIAGNYVNSPEFAFRQAQRNIPYGDLDYELVRQRDFFYGQHFYRAYARLDLDPVVFIAGRQKIDWGVMRLFSPTDLFTRLPIFDIEKDERVGVTAANVTVTPMTGLKINAVYAIDPDIDQSRIGGRITKTLGRFDVSALGGRFLQDEMVGFDLTGDVKKAGVRGEFIYDHAQFAKDFVQLAAGVDYGWENSLYVAVEYFFNGQATNTFVATPLLPLGTQIQSRHKHFVSLQLKYDITPLWKVMLMNVVDVAGGSFFVNPETRYAPLSWLEFTGGAHVPIGRARGEFTAIPNVYYLQTQMFF